MDCFSGGGASGSSTGFATINWQRNILSIPIPGKETGTLDTQDGAFDSEVESILPKLKPLFVLGLDVGPHLVQLHRTIDSTWRSALSDSCVPHKPWWIRQSSGGGA